MIEAVPPRSWRWHFPLRLAGGLNAREHFRVRAKRVARERSDTRISSLASLGRGWWKAVELPVEVVITRFSPRLLDTDNLSGSAKSVRDEIAAMLAEAHPGFSDGPLEGRATWRVEQRKGPFGVEVNIRSLSYVEVT